MEIERKFLINKIAKTFQTIKEENVIQGYIFVSSSGEEVRIREKANHFYLTINLEMEK